METVAHRQLVWIVDRSADCRAQLQRQLDAHQFDVRTFADARDIERRLARERPSIMLLERLFDGEDGLTICQRIRHSGDDVPIIFLSALNSAQDRIAGFNIGADDYLGKPFDTEELVARMHALLRRRSALPSGAPQFDRPAFQFGDCELIFASCSLYRAGKKIELTSGEFAVLSALARHANRPLTRERLIELAHGPDYKASERSIDVQISRLRRLVERDAENPHHLQTVWGYGYVFITP
ncbi:MAG: ompR [Verrucomicrobiaceae bacterium]|nr:ompR [Verrucomicrobiaceae bacterium]